MTQRIKMLVPLAGISTGRRTVQVETEGFTGEGCKAATEALKHALGAVQTEELKQEYYETPPEQHEHISE